MDGYIKNKMEARRSVRKKIFAKYAVTIPFLLMILVWLFGILSMQSPDSWYLTEIDYSHISSERMGLQRFKSDIINTERGDKYVVPSKLVSVEYLRETLRPGEVYLLVYSETAGGKHIKALYNEENVFLDCLISREAWEEERAECFTGLYITIGIEMIALVLIDRFWCKEEYSKVHKLNQIIKRRDTRNCFKEE